MRPSFVLVAALGLIVGCGNRNDSIVVVTLSSVTPVDVASVRTQATAGGVSRAFTLSPSGGTAATPLTYGIDVPHDITGMISLHVDAFDANGNSLGGGDGSTPIKAGGRADVDITLVGGDAPDLGGDDVGADSPADMAELPPDLSLPPMLALDKTSQAFGDVTINKTSSPTTFVLTNTGTVPTMMPSLTIGGSTPADFTITTDCNAPVAALDKCHVTATLTPKSAGPKQATFTIDAGTGVSASGTVTGNGLTPGQLSMTPDTGSCGSALLNVTSTTTASFTVKNTGQTATGTLAISSSDSQFTVSGCAQALMPNATCTLTVTFKPTARGVQNSSIKAGDGAGDPSPATGSVSGTGLSPATLSISPSPYTFPSSPRLSPGGSQSFQVTNTGDVATNSLIASAITGTNASAFSITTDGCGGSPLAPIPSSCSVTVKFTPAFTGSHSAALAIRDASSTLKSVTLGGSGTPIWTRELSSSAISGSLQSVWAADTTHAWAVGDNAAIYARAANGTWTSQATSFASPPNFTYLTGTGATDLWGSDGSFFYRSTGDGTWKATGFGSTTSVGGIFPFSANDVWVMTTDQGGLGSNFMQVSTATKYTQSGTTSETAYQGCKMMWGTAESNLYCAYEQWHCGADCIKAWGIAHRDATGTWGVSDAISTTTLAAPTQTLWGSGASDVYYCASNARPLHYNGTSWVAVDPSAPTGVLSIWGSAASNVYFVGAFGIVQGNGSTWGTPYQPNGLSAAGVYGTGANDVYVVGSDSAGMCVYHWF